MTPHLPARGGDTGGAAGPASHPAAQPGPHRGRGASGSGRSTWVSPYLYISPFFIVFLVVGLFPLVYTAWVSVHDWSLLGGKGEFVGLENYREVSENPYFLKQTVNTLSIFLLSSGPQIVIAVVLAALLDNQLRGRTMVADEHPAAVRRLARSPWRSSSAASSATGTASINQGLGAGRHRRDRLAHRPVRQPPRHRHDGQLALDRLQRADLPGRHAGRAARPLRVGRARRRRPGPAVPPRSRCR